MPSHVMAKWCEINSNSGVFIGRGNNALSIKAEEELRSAENFFHYFFDFDDEYNFIYSKNVTEAINVLAISLIGQIRELDIILVGPYEHHSNYLPWKYLAKKTGALFCEIPIDVNGNPDYSYISRNKERIKVLTLSAVSNAFGYCIDVEKVCDLIGENTMLFIDQSQVTAHKKIVVNKEISAHFLSSHKMYGPKNIALTAIRKDLITKLNPIILGGGMVETVGFNDSWVEGRRKFFAGTMDIGLIGAWAESCRFIDNISYELIQQKEKYHAGLIRDILHKCGFDEICIDNNCVEYIISFRHNKIHAHDVNEFLSKNNVIIRSGNLCTQNSLRRIGVNAINRVSLGIGLREVDIEILNKKMEELIL
jgi:cysteine desulfurase/selenocysteine lyase